MTYLGDYYALKIWEQFLRIDGWKSDYESVDVFLRHYSRRVKSEKTRENVCFTLKGLCEFARESPDDIVKESPEKASELVQEYIDSLAYKGYSTRYVNVCLAFLKTFFKVNDFKGSRELSVQRHYQPSRYMKRSEYIPTSSEIYNMAYAAGTKRNRALILSLYTSGLRNSTLRALLIGDVRKELESQNEIVTLSVYPEMKKIDEAACKGNIPYYTFIARDSVEALRDYIEHRTQTEGRPNDAWPLFSSDSHSMSLERKSSTPVMKKSLGAMIKTAARKAGVERWKDVYPHCLRKAFESALRNAGLDPKDQEFLMGHILLGSQDTYYDKTKVEEMRTKYSRVVFFPDKKSSAELEKAKIEMLFNTARLLNFPEERISEIKDAVMKLETPTANKALELITKSANLGSSFYVQKQADKIKTSTPPNDRNGKPYQSKIVNEKELVSHMEEGWEIIRELANGKFLLRKPNHIAHVVNQEE